MGRRFNRKYTTRVCGMMGFSDRCNDNDVYARIILPLLNHYTCGVTPGVTATRWGLGPRLI